MDENGCFEKFFCFPLCLLEIKLVFLRNKFNCWEIKNVCFVNGKGKRKRFFVIFPRGTFNLFLFYYLNLSRYSMWVESMYSEEPVMIFLKIGPHEIILRRHVYILGINLVRIFFCEFWHLMFHFYTVPSFSVFEIVQNLSGKWKHMGRLLAVSLSTVRSRSSNYSSSNP
jgi:hypothetical protein